MCKTVYWDLININMNRDVQEGCANGLDQVCTCSSNTDDENSECFKVNNESCKCLWDWVCVKEPDGLREEAPPQSLSFCHPDPEALARWQWNEEMITGVIWVFEDFSSVWGRCPAERGEQTLRCVQLSARLSAELCSPDLRCFYTTLRCTESIHFL